MGPLTPEQTEMFLRNPRFLGLKFPDMSRPETLEKRYVGKLTKKALSFMKGMLIMDPSKRLGAHDALQHSYFDGLREEHESQVQANLSARSRGERSPSARSEASTQQQVQQVTREQVTRKPKEHMPSVGGGASRAAGTGHHGAPDPPPSRSRGSDAGNEASRLPSKQGNRSGSQSTESSQPATPIQTMSMSENSGNRPRTQATSDLLGGGLLELDRRLGVGGAMAIGDGPGSKHGLQGHMLKPPRTRDGLQGLDEDEIARRRSTKNDAQLDQDDASERRRRNQGVPGMGQPTMGQPTIMELSGNYGYANQAPPPSRGEGQRSKPHFVKDPKRQSGEAPMMKMEVLVDPKSPRNQPGGGYGSLSKGKQSTKGLSKLQMPNLLPQGEMRASKSSHGNRMKQEVVLVSAWGYKSVSGYNSRQIPVEDRHLLNSMPLEPR
jgi:hypothetical protein